MDDALDAQTLRLHFNTNPKTSRIQFSSMLNKGGV
uniref:Uncharacterized protein n=1 Tax=Arundo donax TaxID=35708 RepID=A0A0A9B9M1_ARUDO